ncbi:MAG: cysteine--tRNA ligase [Chthoniobacterales bacterium]|nr:cysteine--tRNA ligase [Chthoniobacterales bacterium]
MIRFHNTLTRSVEPFVPLDPDGKTVRLYTCGPTVYNHAHIGNFRAYIFEDLLQRHLEYRGFDVRRVMNLTDVDDKTIRGAREKGIPLADFTRPFKEAFFQDLDTLRIKPAAGFPCATEPEHIARMIAMIEKLVAAGHAYKAEDASVYFRIASFPSYGKLAHLNLEELRPSGRVRSDEYEKESIGDFALWKAHDREDGDVKWDSPWGPGRPGWHIECSAMATALLGDRLDIHCGGVDNIFPHHEAEIAQTECCTGAKFVNLWMHCAHLMVDGRKMAKSFGNFYTLRDLLDKGWTGREVRYVLLSAHYRLPLNFTFEGLAGARSALQRLDEWQQRLSELASTAAQSAPHPLVAGDKFAGALDDDLNISAALGALFDLVRDTNRAMDKGEVPPEEARGILDYWQRINSVLRLEADATGVPAEITALLEERNAARAAKDWSKSDVLRDELLRRGWVVKDTKDGTKLTRTGA